MLFEFFTKSCFPYSMYKILNSNKTIITRTKIRREVEDSLIALTSSWLVLSDVDTEFVLLITAEIRITHEVQGVGVVTWKDEKYIN